MHPATRAREITPEMVLAYREALADTRRLTGAPLPVRAEPPVVARPLSDDIQRDHAIHQAGRIAWGLACATGAVAAMAAFKAISLYLEHGV